MIKDKPFIYPFSTPGGYYIYDVNTNVIMKVEESAYKFLHHKLYSNDDVDAEKTDKLPVISKMMDDGFLLSNKIKKIEHSETGILTDILSKKLPSITLQVTQQCNLRCRYCIYSGSYLNRRHSKKVMSLDVAKKGIDFLIDHSIACDIINIGFYGGEPLLEFELIKNCVEYAEKKAEGKKITFNLTSNGTLLSKEIIEYFEKHNIGLMISIDGPKEIQDKNRKFALSGDGTFDKVISNLEMIKNDFPKYFEKITFNAVMDKDNNFNCSNDFFTNYETFRNSLVSISLVSSNYSEKNNDISEEFHVNQQYEIFKLFLSKLNKLDEIHVSKLVLPYLEQIKLIMYDKRKPTRKLPEKVHHGGPCIPGAHRLFMNVNGDFFPCERVSEASEIMKIGSIDHGFYIDKVKKLLNIGQITEDNCKNCWNFRFCNLCAACADDLTDLSDKSKLMQCPSTINATKNMMKDYCMLTEFGYRFSDNDKLILSYK